MTNDATLVLGGGGVAGIAWETGLLAGLASRGLDVTDAAFVQGTSAGSTVASQIRGSWSIAELYERQLAGVPYEISQGLGGVRLLKFLVAQMLPGGQQRASKRVADLAVKQNVGLVAERHGVIEARLPDHEWPASPLSIVAVDVATGLERVFTRADGAALVDVVEASCAVPLVWPPVSVGGRLYVDGGARSPVNLDLAPGSGPVIAIAPVTASFRRVSAIATQAAALAPRPVELITMSDESKAAQGRNSLDPSVVPAVARAGFAQAESELARIEALLARS